MEAAWKHLNPCEPLEGADVLKVGADTTSFPDLILQVVETVNAKAASTPTTQEDVGLWWGQIIKEFRR